MKTHRQIFIESINKAVIAVLAAATLFFVAFTWAAATGESLVADVESGFSVKALGLALAAAAVFVIMTFIVGRTKSHDGKSKERATEMALEYLDDFSGLLASSGAIALLMLFNGRGITYGIWGAGLILLALGGKHFCAFHLQKLAR